MSSSTSVGHIFNMDGAGADGSATPRFAAYGATKHGLNQLSKSLQVCVACLTPATTRFDAFSSARMLCRLS